MSVKTVLLHLLTWLLVALTPGPAVMCVVSQAARHGLRAGFAGILGIQIGNFIFFVCVAFGLAALLAAATNAMSRVAAQRSTLNAERSTFDHFRVFLSLRGIYCAIS